MRTIELKVYEFQELSDAAKQTAINEYRDINTDYEWYTATYEDAASIGLEIKGFDLYANRIQAELIQSVAQCCEDIIATHGESTSTYALAVSAKHWLEDAEKVDDAEFDADVEERFRRALSSAYLSLLKEELEYLESGEAVIEAISANGYEFYENGKKY